MCAELHRKVSYYLIGNATYIETGVVRHVMRSNAMDTVSDFELNISENVKCIYGNYESQMCVTGSTDFPYDCIATNDNINIENHNQNGNKSTNGKGAVAIANSKTEDHQAKRSIYCHMKGIADANIFQDIVHPR